MADTRLKIAVFIDFDNIEIGVKSTLGVQFDIGVVLEALKERGDVVSKIAYGDWTRAGDYSRSLTQHATKLVQRNLTPGGDKNGADINLALDALEMAFTHGHINAYVIVGGDSDFITLVEKLKQYDKQIFVVGGRAFTSLVMQRNCHEFIAYENLVGSAPLAPIAAARADRRASQASIEQAVPLVRRALKVLSRSRGLAAARAAEEHAAAARLDVLRADLRRGQLPRFRAEARRRPGTSSLRESGRNVLVELAEGNGSGATSRAAHAPAPHEATASPSRGAGRARGCGAVQRQPAQSRGRPTASAKCGGCSSRRRTRRAGRCTSARRSSSSATSTRTFDERKFGFASLVDLLRACQREGLFRIERDRQGVMRLFPGNVMQPAARRRPTIAATSPEPAAAEPSSAGMGAAEPARRAGGRRRRCRSGDRSAPPVVDVETVGRRTASPHQPKPQPARAAAGAARGRATPEERARARPAKSQRRRSRNPPRSAQGSVCAQGPEDGRQAARASYARAQERRV